MAATRPRRSPPPWWLSLVPVALAAAYLATRWSSIPERWASHWGPGGVPNGWSTRTVAGVFGPLLIPLLLLGTFELIGAMVRARAKPETAELGTATVGLLRGILLVMSASISFAAAALPFGRFEGLTLVYVMLVLLVLALAIGLTRLSLAMNELRARGHHPQLKGPGAFAVYHDPKDRRLWVPKVLGVGYTINFAHRWAWPAMLLLVLGPLALVLLVLWTVGRR